MAARQAARTGPHRRRRFGLPGDDRGSSALTLAVAAPVVLLLGFLGIQVALVSYARSTASTAAAEAADAERAYNAAPGAGSARGNDFLRRANGLTGSSVTVTRTATDVTVTIRGQALSLIPGMTFNVTRQDTGSRETFRTS